MMFPCCLQTFLKTPIPSRPPARRARARSAWPDPCATGRWLAVPLCLIVLAPSRQGHFALVRVIERRQRGPKSSSSGAGDDADSEALSAIEHQEEIVGIGGVDRLDRGVGDGIEDSAIVVLVMNRKGPPFQKTGDREPDVAGVGLDGNLIEPVRPDFPVACLALPAVEFA